MSNQHPLHVWRELTPLNSAPPSKVVENIIDSDDASLEKDVSDEAEKVRKLLKATGKRKQITESLGKETHHRLRKVPPQASKVAGDASDPLDMDSDPNIHEFPSAKELKDSADCHWVRRCQAIIPLLEFDQAGDDLATASYPFIAEATADPYAYVEELLLKKPKSLCMKPALSHSKPSSSKIFQYLKNIINIGLRYPKDIGFNLIAFLDLDHVGFLDIRKSTYGGIKFLGGDKLVSWSSKKQDCTSMSSAEVELKRVLFFVRTEYQLVDLFTKGLSEDRFKYLVKRLGMRCLTPKELEILANESA
ncbi:hypothetical protein Tco_1006136 [Tanacetum coccineum]|uniref:Retrovirus-related Pol polyprotein from transposon TNT 1-94 n=1 Tax=Tanacetum coccineum TaxID=301880 RepID=A0ABQ5FHT3_9ASTR